MFGRDSNALCTEAIPFYLTLSAFHFLIFLVIQFATASKRAPKSSACSTCSGELNGAERTEGETGPQISQARSKAGDKFMPLFPFFHSTY